MVARSRIPPLLVVALAVALTACGEDVAAAVDEATRDGGEPPADAALQVERDGRIDASEGSDDDDAEASCPCEDADADAQADAGEQDAEPEDDAADAQDAEPEQDAAPEPDAEPESPSCTNAKKDGVETDVDCGGAVCGPCGLGLACAEHADCSSTHCGTATETCVNGPEAGFSLSATSGAAPLLIQATSTASQGETAITSVRYQWEGGALSPTAAHLFGHAGTFTVRQEVVDENGVTASATQQVSLVDYAAVRFSATDRTPEVLLSGDGFDAEIAHDVGGVRSNRSVASGSGVFYFEGAALPKTVYVGSLGVATAGASLASPMGSMGQSLGLLTPRDFMDSGATCVARGQPSGQPRRYGFVVDYRASNPKVHFVLPGDGNAPTVVRTCTMNVTAPLFIFYQSDRWVIGPHMRINTGADTVNHPFFFSSQGVRNALTAIGETAAASAIVFGYGRTRALHPDTAPTLSVSSNVSVAPGTPVTVTGVAQDALEGPLSHRIEWRDMSLQHHAPLTGSGASFTFSPTRLGRHPVRARVTDSVGLTSERTVMVTVTGSVETVPQVRLVPDALSGPGVVVSADGLSARFTGSGKQGIRANQGIYGQFWYFEVRRNVGPVNLGAGLIILDGALNPYSFTQTPWSMSINFTGSVWRNLIWQSNWPAADAHYGFAVDYRGEHPIVYVITGGVLRATITMDDVWGPVYPMLYGNAQGTVAPNTDTSINFGASAFQFNPRTILTGAGIDATALELGWGDANTP